jgi:ethanolamine-phosphate cytidylyltransferase
MKDEERVKSVQACKWVDEIAFGVPYSPTVALLDQLNCDFAVHGDDMPTNAEGTSAFGEVIKAGRCKIIKRTEGISTTSLVGRLLLMTREHHMPVGIADSSIPQPELNTSKFLLSSQRIFQFSRFSDPNYKHEGLEGKKIVYLDGSFDLFHVGHIEVIEKAKALGDFLMVGIHDDKTVNQIRGHNYPIMNLQERVLNVLACKAVDEVIMGAPWSISKELITTLKISVITTLEVIDYPSKVFNYS